MASEAARDELLGVVGYLVFSDGAPSNAFYRAIDRFFRTPGADDEPIDLSAFDRALAARLDEWERDGSSPFGDLGPARRRLRFALDEIVPGYRHYHRDLLHHLPDSDLWQPFMVARVLETAAALDRDATSDAPIPRDDFDRTEPVDSAKVCAAVRRMSDFLGYRPVATLENRQSGKPYLHEYSAAIPIYLQGVGPGYGPFESIVISALEHLRAADPGLLADVWLDLDNLEEVSIDSRAYDYHHPINGRVGHQFGEWDPHRIDLKGRYRRFMIRLVILDVLREWLSEDALGEEREVIAEAGAVLAGTFLLASGACGGGPEDLTSELAVPVMVTRIARVRDAFYTNLVNRWPGKHGERLRREAERDKQPFGRLRQHLNLQLSTRRALQMHYDGVARQFARMGYADAALETAELVAVPSTRLHCLMETIFTRTEIAIREERLEDAADGPSSLVDLLYRAIGCGAEVDPWNILGFGGQFPWFTHTAESGADHRVEELLERVERLFGLWARLWAAAAAAGRSDLADRCSLECQAFADRWNRYATHEVSDVRHVDSAQLRRSGEFVAKVLTEWRTGGAAAGDLAFWRKHAEGFDAEQSFALIVEALLQRQDLQASQALIVHWLGSGAAEVHAIDDPFPQYVRQWLDAALARPDPERGRLVRRFFELLEANADAAWHAPGADVLGVARAAASEDDEESEAEGETDDDDPYAAAYEGMTYRDSTGDGVEGEVLEPGGGGRSSASDSDLAALHKPLLARFRFLHLVAELLQRTAQERWPADDPAWSAALAGWAQHAFENRRRLFELIAALHAWEVPTPESAGEALLEFDRQRALKEELLDAAAGCAVETVQTLHLLSAAAEPPADSLADWELALVRVHAALRAEDRRKVRALLPKLFVQLRPLRILYVPLRAGGHPRAFAQSRIVREALKRLASDLPWLGLFRETADLLRVARALERNGPRDNRQVTEFEAIFTAGYRHVLEVVVRLLAGWRDTKVDDSVAAGVVGEMVEKFTDLWSEHVAGVRISDVETKVGPKAWADVKSFIGAYGRELFSPRFMQYGNLRGVLAQGVGEFLRLAEEEGDENAPTKLLEDIEAGRLKRGDAEAKFQFVITVVVNHYDLFRDYSATTTQSDYGDNLFAFFELLRVSVEYDRSWFMMRTIYVAHRMLTAWGRQGAAEFLERGFAAEMADSARQRALELQTVEREYGVRLAAVRAKIDERFVRPLAIDRALAFVEPALKGPDEAAAFEALREALAEFAKQPSGAGFDPPDWLLQFEKEVDRVLGDGEDEYHHPRRHPPKMRPGELETLLANWDKPRR